MKKLLIFLSLFIILSITTVEAISFDKTNEVSWDFKNNEHETYNRVLKYENDYIYTEAGYDNNNDQRYYKIIRKSNKGKTIWQKKITVDYIDDFCIDIVLVDDKVFLTIFDYKTVIISAKDGSITKESDDVFGYNISLFNDNIVISNGDILYIIDRNLNIQYKLDKSNTNNFWMYNIYIENNVIYALIEENDYHYILELNGKLEITKRTKLTYDANQGYLSEEDYFEEYSSFVKVGDNFYQIGYDVYKITPSGKTTLVLEDDIKNEFEQYESSNAGITIGENLILLETIWDSRDETGYVRYTIYDDNFKKITSIKVSDLETKPHSWPASISPIENGFIVKWFDEYNSFNSNITEYKQNKAACKIISGTGKNIGDEISCGTENFYIIENDGEKVKALSKYNLYVGRDYYKIDFGKNFSNNSDAKTYYNDNYSNQYDGVEKYLVKDNYYYGVIAYKTIQPDKILQNEKAIGAHGNLKVEPTFPELGVLPNDPSILFNYIMRGIISEDYSEGYFDIFIDSTSTSTIDWLYYFEGYERSLAEQNVNVEKTSIISVSELSELVETVTGKPLPLEEWYTNRDNWGIVTENGYSTSHIVGSIKDLMPAGYEWLWSTTYLTRTADSERQLNLFFVDTIGDLCSGDYCNNALGAGIRPVITMSVEELEYKIETKTDNKGTIEVKPSSGTGEKVQVTITPKKGYELKEVKVTDAEGNVLIFTNNTFTMPSSNVTIEAIFEVKNPNTTSISILAGLIFAIVSIAIIKLNYSKLRWINE